MDTISKYSTHLPVLQKLFELVKIETVFEFGMGLFSTRFFEEHAKRVISIEMNKESWFDKVNASGSWNNVTLHYMPGPTDAVEYLASSDEKWDLVFVDGHADGRSQGINAAFEKTGLIVVHDTETAFAKRDPYRWSLVKARPDFIWLDVFTTVPWTSVVCKDEHVIGKIMRGFPESLVRQ